ncbi:unnamed protein product [Pelagomonas calceolata]|uniref:Uncharacterized protein n=1 Tax=Pelagomonas calceolata TaxID=35677 RepID=A0A8J2SQF2_9STRA|nr:unnamed protein product [Pelagomonas calceolata]
MPPGRATGREQRHISHTEVVFRLHQAVVAAFHDVAQRPRRAVHDVHVLEDDEIRRDLRQVDGSDNDLVVALRVHRQHDQVVPQIVLVQERPHRGGPDLDVDDECFQIRNPVLVLKDVLQRQRRDLTRERGRKRLAPGGRFEAASVAARRGIDERVVYGVKRDHAVPVRDRPVHDRDAVRRVCVRGDERREVPVDAWLRLASTVWLITSSASRLNGSLALPNARCAPTCSMELLRHDRASAATPSRRHRFARCGRARRTQVTFRPVWFKKRKFGQPWLRSSTPTAAATSTALWAALIVHARSALAWVRTPYGA